VSYKYHIEYVVIYRFLGVKRKEGREKTVKRAKPITMAMLSEAVQLLDQHTSLRIWRTVWRMMVCYFCFLRFDDVRRLKVIAYPVWSSFGA